MRTCRFPDCGRPHRARDLCVSHWEQWRTARQLWPIGSRRNHSGGKPWIGRADEIVAEVELMLTGGETAEGAAKRLGYTQTRSLYRALSRAGRADLWRRLQQGTPATIHTHERAA